jgi:hypothetical protein
VSGGDGEVDWAQNLCGLAGGLAGQAICGSYCGFAGVAVGFLIYDNRESIADQAFQFEELQAQILIEEGHDIGRFVSGHGMEGGS